MNGKLAGRALLIVCVAATLLVTWSEVQAADLGTVVFIITDTRGNPIHGATVRVERPENGAVQGGSATDRRGIARVRVRETGEFRMVVIYKGDKFIGHFNYEGGNVVVRYQLSYRFYY